MIINRIRRFSYDYLAPAYYIFMWGKTIVGLIVTIFFVDWYFLDRYITQKIISVFSTLYFFSPEPFKNTVKHFLPEKPLAIAALFIAIVASIYFFRKFLKFGTKFRKSQKAYRNCLENYLEMHDQHFSNLLCSKKITKSQANQLNLISSMFLKEATTAIASIFELFTRRRCHATIKSYNKQTRLVQTKARDQLDHNVDRIQTDEAFESFRYDENTAYKTIIDDESKNIYLSNHLRLWNLLGIYENKNEGWTRFYNSTVVIPITEKQHPVAINHESVIGFICVDNKGGGFNNKIAKALLRPYILLLRNAMVILGKIEDMS